MNNPWVIANEKNKNNANLNYINELREELELTWRIIATLVLSKGGTVEIPVRDFNGKGNSTVEIHKDEQNQSFVLKAKP